jgi:Zn-dependent M28 family amino/carboxypeptidase
MNNRKQISKFFLLNFMLFLLIAPFGHADVGVDTTALREAVTVDGVRAHQAALQAIADANGGIRTSGTPGYDESADYVATTLEAAGYSVTIQPFSYIAFRQLGPSTLEQSSPGFVTYVENTDYGIMTHSDAGDVTGLVTAVDIDPTPNNVSTSGCEPGDFTGFPAGNIALLQRGSCFFRDKAENAAAAGAVGVIIFNQGNIEDRKDLFSGTLLDSYSGGIPVLATTYDRGVEWAGTSGLELHMIVDVFRGLVETSNIIAETSEGRDDRVVVVGAHLDSVAQGPGIQDNGSGSSAILEIALQMADLGITPRNKVRFAWWGAEEDGLLGSQFYVNNLSKRDIKNIALYLNFDMIGSPNFVRFVYDGDGSDTSFAGSNGSANIEDVFLSYFADQSLPVEATAINSAHSPQSFMSVRIPIGGLFGGADGIKTEEQASIYGGVAGEQYDPCFHLACDTFDNVSLQALDEMSDAAAHSVIIFAMTKASVNGTDKEEEIEDLGITSLE